MSYIEQRDIVKIGDDALKELLNRGKNSLTRSIQFGGFLETNQTCYFGLVVLSFLLLQKRGICE